MARHARVKPASPRLVAPIVAGLSALILVLGVTSAVGASYPYPPPSSPKQVDKTGTSVTVKWNSVPTANLYYVRYATNSAMTQNKSVVSSKTTQKNISGLKPNTTYYIQVRAARGTTSSHTLLTDYGPWDDFKTYSHSFSPPGSFRADYSLKNSVGLSWNFVNNADSYRVSYSTSGEPTRYVRVKDTSTLRRISHEVTGLTNGKTYTFRVQALEQNIDPNTNYYYELTDWSGAVNKETPPVSVGTDLTERPPSEPTLTTISSSKIGLAWNPVSGSTATGYRIQYNYGGTTYYASMPSHAPNVTFTNTIPNDAGSPITIAKGRDFTFRVAALKTGSPAGGVRISDYSSGLAVSPSYDQEPPGDLRVDSFTGDSATISWNPVAGATQYRVDWTRSANPGGACEEKDNSCVKTGNALTTYTINDLRPGVTYYFRVSAVGTAGTISDYQPVMVSATTVADAPQMVKQVPNSPASTTAITMQWSPSLAPGVQSYQLRWSTDQNMAGSTTINVGSNLTRQITGLSPERLHFVQVRGQYLGGTYTGWSAITSAYTRPNRGSITGRVNDVAGTNSSAETIVYAYENNSTDVGGVARPAADGTFTIWDLPPGAWRLHYAYLGAEDATSPWYRSSGTLPFYKSEAQDVSVNATNVNIATVTPVGGISIRGSVTGTLCLAGTRVTALSNNSAISGAKNTVLGDTRTGSNGSYVIHGLPKNESYWLRFASTNCGTKSVLVSASQTGGPVVGVNTEFGTSNPDPDPDPGTSGVVENVKFTSPVSNDATITWDAFPNAAKYRIYWSTSSSMPGACEPTCQLYTVAELDGNSPPSMSLKKVVGNVRAGGVYYIKISATDSSNRLVSRGGWSTIKSVDLPGAAESIPSTVTGIHLDTMNSSGAKIGWNPIPTATKYRVYYTRTASMPSSCGSYCEVIVPADRANPTFTITSSKLDRRFVKVSAITTVNGKDKTITGWQTTPFTFSGSEPSDVVQGLAVQSGTVAANDASITWNAFPGAQQYRVYWSTVAAMPGSCEPTCQVYSLSELDGASPPRISLKKVVGNVRAGAMYYFMVSALDAGGRLVSTGGWQSAPLRIDLTGAAVSLPSEVKNISVKSDDASGVTLQWTAVPTATKYRVYYTPTSSMPSACGSYCEVIVPADRANPTFKISSSDRSRRYVKISAITTENGKDRTFTGWQSSPFTFAS